MKYRYLCGEHGEIIHDAPMAVGPPPVVTCPECHKHLRRIYERAPDIWHTQGAHKTDYDKSGDKLERLNREWSKRYGEDPPEPAKDIPKNSADPI